MHLIELDSVSFGYKKQLILENISITIDSGDYVGLIGPNGSGKSTLVKIILGLLSPNTGSAKLFGEPIERFTAWQKIGYVGQRPAAAIQGFPITVYETVAMTGAKKSEVVTSLREVEMEEHINSPLLELSGGQQQRVFIARALARKPELLVLDEPTAGVDTESQSQFYALLKKFHSRGMTLLIVSHDVDVIAHEVNHLLCVNKTIVCHGKPHEVINGAFWKKVYGQDISMIVHGH